ncbi:MAG TPA: cyclic nucleotide-binding domain-containing protein [Pantanalinema sp.]
MKKVLFILGELSDSDVDWLVEVGDREAVAPGRVLIKEASAIDHVYVILEGRFGVSVAALSGKEVAQLGCGEIVGEMSLVDQRPPSATVTALEPGLVLSVPRREIERKLAQDMAFSARFHRALTVFLSDRLRSTVSRLGYGQSGPMDQETEYEDELDMGVLDKAALAGARFDWLLKRMKGA